MKDPQWQIIYLIAAIWATVWQAIALWRSARLEQRNWFIVILILPPLGILPLVYLFRFAKKRMTILELKKGFRSMFLN